MRINIRESPGTGPGVWQVFGDFVRRVQEDETASLQSQSLGKLSLGSEALPALPFMVSKSLRSCASVSSSVKRV